MSDDYTDRLFGVIVAPQVYKRIDQTLEKYLDAAPDHEISDSAVVFILRKLWVEPDRYAVRVQALGLGGPSGPPVAPPAG